MRIVDRQGFWLSLCVIAFALAMGGIHWLQKGISPDFGMGFTVGGLLFGFLTMLAVGWRRREWGPGSD